MGGIFILKRNLIISVALTVAWVFVTIFAFVSIHNQQKMIENVEYIEVAKVETEQIVVVESVEKVENISETENRIQATSRSGLSIDRENPKIFYEEINVDYTEEELEIFERIVEAEVSTNNYEGKLAVANVILNRVESEKFPNTIKEVVFANRQFSPISDGRYYKVKISELTKKVVEDALNGYRIVGRDAYYFCTPTAPGKGWFETDLRKIDYIKPHNFYGYKN